MLQVYLFPIHQQNTGSSSERGVVWDPFDDSLKAHTKEGATGPILRRGARVSDPTGHIS